jgi:endonuclease/exonuclease/phosphatase family metal-dependent hydrolase
MKVISLNAWGGEAGTENLMAFLQAHADTDVFCLQEIWNGGEEMLGTKSNFELAKRNPRLLLDIQEALPDYAVYFRPFFYDYYGIALFIRNTVVVKAEGEAGIYKEKGYISEGKYADHGRILQYATIETPEGDRTIIHLHGLWHEHGKDDCDDRLTQSERIIDFVSGIPTPVVLVGDFNLRPDTQSMKKLEAAGLRNLITEYGITSTRTSHYTRSEKFADYALVGEGIEVKAFKVLPDEVSDHAPLYLEFS